MEINSAMEKHQTVNEPVHRMLVRRPSDNLPMVMSRINCEGYSVQDIARENASRTVLEHPNLLRVYDIFLDGNGNVTLFEEYCEEGSIVRHLSWIHVRKAMQEIALAVEYLHRRHIVHNQLTIESMYLRNGAVCLGHLSKFYG